MVQLVSEYDISVYEQYAKGKQGLEDFLRTYDIPINATGSIAAQATFRGLIPLPSHVSLFTGENRKRTWPNFAIPVDFLYQRSGSSLVMPSLSSEQVDADLRKIENLVEVNQDPLISIQAEKLTSLLSIGVQEQNTLRKEITGKILALLAG